MNIVRKTMCFVALALFLQFLIVSNSFAGEVYQNQNLTQQYCAQIIGEEQKIVARHPLTPEAKTLWELNHPGCYPNAQSQNHSYNSILDQLDSIFVTAFTAMSAISNALFFSLAFFAVFMVGARIALGAETGVMLPIGRVLISLLVTYGLINFWPTIQNSIISFAQTSGFEMSKTIGLEIKTQLAAAAPEAFSSRVLSLIPNSGTLDPVGLLKVGADSMGAPLTLMSAQMASEPHWYDKVSFFYASLGNFFTLGLNGLVQMVIFSLFGLEALLILLESKLIFVFAPLALVFRVFNPSNSGLQFDYGRKLLDALIGLAAKIVVFYLVIELIAGLRALTLQHDLASLGGFFVGIEDLAAVLVFGLAGLWAMHWSGKIFGHNGAALAAAVGGFVGSSAATLATAGASKAGTAAFGALKKEVDKGREAGKGKGMGEIGKGAFKGQNKGQKGEAEGKIPGSAFKSKNGESETGNGNENGSGQNSQNSPNKPTTNPPTTNAGAGSGTQNTQNKNGAGTGGPVPSATFTPQAPPAGGGSFSAQQTQQAPPQQNKQQTQKQPEQNEPQKPKPNDK